MLKQARFKYGMFGADIGKIRDMIADNNASSPD
jgi:hypothetical protein